MIIIIAIMMIMMTKPRRSACTSALQRNSPDTSLAVKSWESEGIARTNRFLKTISMFCWFCTKLLREWGNCTNKQVLILLMCCYVSLYKTKERGNCTNEQVFNFFSAKSLPWLKCFEYFGEALPQLAISITFITHNYAFVENGDSIFGVPFPVSILSATFSSGSLVYGLYSGVQACRVHF